MRDGRRRRASDPWAGRGRRLPEERPAPLPDDLDAAALSERLGVKWLLQRGTRRGPRPGWPSPGSGGAATPRSSGEGFSDRSGLPAPTVDRPDPLRWPPARGRPPRRPPGSAGRDGGGRVLPGASLLASRRGPGRPRQGPGSRSAPSASACGSCRSGGAGRRPGAHRPARACPGLPGRARARDARAGAQPLAGRLSSAPQSRSSAAFRRSSGAMPLSLYWAGATVPSIARFSTRAAAMAVRVVPPPS